MKITAHSSQAKLNARLKAIGESLDGSLDGAIFRFINPEYSKAADIVNGAGALHANGRWNLKGMARLSYTALTPKTALSEALAHVNYYGLPPAKAFPLVLVALRLKAQRVLDLRDGKVRKALILSEVTIKKLDWRTENRKGVEAITQAWGRAFAKAGYEAVIVPSAAEPDGANVLVFPENFQPGSHFDVDGEVKWPKK